MNEYIQRLDVVIEVGCGAGFSELYLDRKVILSDLVKNEWVEIVLDAQSLELEDGSVDAIIAQHTIHHFASPSKFFRECERVLKDGGLIIIQDISASLLMRLLLKVRRHEGWSYETDVFNEDQIANDPRDPWSANCAIPDPLFEQEDLFHVKFPQLQIIKNQRNECLLFPLSGGVIAKTRVPKLPFWLLRLVSYLDKVLIWIAPNIFALGRSVVIRKSLGSAES